MTLGNHDVRFTPESGHRLAAVMCALCQKRTHALQQNVSIQRSRRRALAVMARPDREVTFSPELVRSANRGRRIDN
jgi:hypothetical protein